MCSDNIRIRDKIDNLRIFMDNVQGESDFVYLSKDELKRLYWFLKMLLEDKEEI